MPLVNDIEVKKKHSYVDDPQLIESMKMKGLKKNLRDRNV